MNHKTMIKEIALRLEHIDCSDLTVAERQIIDVLQQYGVVYIAEDNSVRISKGWEVG